MTVNQNILISALLFFTYDIGIPADFYVDPVNGSMSNDGSISSPWSKMQDVWDDGKINTRNYVGQWTEGATPTNKNPSGVVHAGDTIHLMSGDQGSLFIAGAINADWITIKADTGATPTFKNIYLRSASMWIFDGITISPSYYEPFAMVSEGLFNVDSHSYSGPSSYIKLLNSSLFSVDSISGWNDQDWLNNASPGVITEGTYSTIENNHIRNVGGSIDLLAAHYSTVKNNLIENSSADALRNAGSDYVKIEYNTIKNIYVVLDYSLYHYDLIQAWTLDGDVAGMEIRGNTLIAHENINQPYQGGVQGIGLFDGWFNDFIIENNLVLIDGTHGISIYGANNSRIVNNTVASNLVGSGAPINLVPHKNQELGSGNVVRNNISYSVSLTNGGYTSGTTSDHNITGFINSDHFNNPSTMDFSLKPSSTAINTGSNPLAPTIDLTRRNRDMTPDIGAYEYFAPGTKYKNVKSITQETP